MKRGHLEDERSNLRPCSVHGRQHNQTPVVILKPCARAQARAALAGAQAEASAAAGPWLAALGGAGLWLAAALLCAASFGCVRKDLPPDACTRVDLGGCIIEDVEVLENATIDDGDIEERIATAETSRVLEGALEKVPLLSLWDSLTVQYELFDKFVLERDLARIERYYRSRGFYEAHARAGRVIRLSRKTVRVEIVVDEGPPIDAIIVNPEFIETDDQKDLARYPYATKLQAAKVAVQDALNELRGKPRFEETDYDEIKRRVVRSLTDRGFAYGTVRGAVSIDIPQRAATVSLKIDFGPHCTFGDMVLKDLGEIPAEPIRSAINIRKGRAYSTTALESAEYALAEYGVFSAVDIKPNLSPEGQAVRSTEIPVTFTFQPAALRTFKAGVGAEVGDRVEAHIVAGWDNRNFLGGLRRFNIESRPGLVFYPLKLGDSESFDQVVPEVKLAFELTQPGFIEARTNGVIRGRFRLFQDRTVTSEESVAPMEGQPEVEPPILGLREYAGTLGVERKFWRSRVSAGLFSHIQFEQPFSYNDQRPPLGYRPLLILPYFEGIIALDERKNAAGKRDKISPNEGYFVGTNLQTAVNFFEDDTGDLGADDVRLQPEVRVYLPISKKVTLALRATSGFLFPRNYGDDLKRELMEVTDEGAALSAAAERDIQLYSFRGFFSGGTNSNRGYGYREVGPFAQSKSFDAKIPTGGRLLWEASLELRFPIVGELRSALFLDGSDVTLGDFRLDRPHLSAGLGLRYDTPVGPLRADVGYRIHCAQTLDTPCGEIPADEGKPSDFLGVPIAVSIAIGEAF